MEHIQVGCHDEIYHRSKAFAVAVEPDSRYCFLVQASEEKLEVTWAESLEHLKARGYNPAYVVADGGLSLRKGLQNTLPDTDCYYDVFHFIRYFGQAILGVKRDQALLNVCKENAQYRVDRAIEQGYEDNESIESLTACSQAVDDRKNEIDSLKSCIGRTLNKTTANGVSQSERRSSYEKTAKAVDDLCRSYCSKYESKARRSLQNLASLVNCQKDNILGLHARGDNLPKHRTSSMVENFNYSLRQQIKRFTHIPKDFLDLAVFHLNHQKFIAARNPSRQGKSPAEILAGSELSAWLDQLVPT